MEAVLAQLPNDAESNELREKQHFLKGVLEWDLQRDYKARLWAERKSLGDLDRQLREAQRRHHEVQSARDDWPEKFAALTARIEALKPRVAGMQTFAQAALEKQQDFLQTIAVGELKAQRDRLNTYMVQARFALASMYDRASARRRPRAITCSGRARDDERAAARAARGRCDLAVRPSPSVTRSDDRHDQGSSRAATVEVDTSTPIAGGEAKAMESLQAVPRSRVQRRAAARGSDAPARRLAAREHRDRRSSRATCRRSAAASAARSRCTRSS